MLIQLDEAGPAYRQIYRQLREAILARDLPPGSRLPSSRRLSSELGVARITVVQAYEQLVAEGYLEARSGSGTRVTAALEGWLDQRHDPASESKPRLSAAAERAVTASPSRPPGHPSTTLRYDFQYGQPDACPELLSDWRRALRKVSANPPTSYPDPMGEPALRECLAAHLRERRGLMAEPARIQIVAGTQQALTLIGRCILDPGDRVLVEEPQYQGARQAFLALGAHPVYVPVDEHGLRTDCLPRQDPSNNPIKLACVTPSHQFPLGGVLPVARRLELLQWASDQGAWIIEDDYDSEFRHEGSPLQSLYSLDRSGRVIYTGTLSKVLFPGLRLGYQVLPRTWIEPARQLKWLNDRGSPALEQLTLAELFRTGAFRRHIERSARHLAERRLALVEALQETFGDEVKVLGSQTGMHLVARWPGLSAAAATQAVSTAARQGVGVYSAGAYYANSGPRCLELLLGYATIKPDDIRKAITILGRIPELSGQQPKIPHHRKPHRHDSAGYE